MENTSTNTARTRDTVIIGAGLTGLTTAYYLTRKNKDIELIEQQNRIGGQIQTFHEDGFTFESGPNTGVISHPEVAELFQELSGCELETARSSSKCRLIWKGNRFHALPSGLFSGISTPLFSLKDKFRLLGEPFRSKGNNPDETVDILARRRLGKSFADYAVDPFLSGIYAGDPAKLITRHALPKLYQLEQRYGSFIKGAIAKAKEPKTERDRLATKEVFSVREGFDRLTTALGKAIGEERITLGVSDTEIRPHAAGWEVRFTDAGGQSGCIHCSTVITTTGAYSLPGLLPFIAGEEMNKITGLRYAPVMQVSVGLRNTLGIEHAAFGGLIPSRENKQMLGILFPSACFDNRAPVGGALFSYFMGGTRHPELLLKSDEEIRSMIVQSLHTMLGYPAETEPDLIRIFRHEKAIPQYEAGSDERLATIEHLQRKHPGLILAGNIKGGIGMADRIQQAAIIASEV